MMTVPKTKIAFTTLGCRVNQYDGQAMKEQVEKASFQTVPFEEPADVYVINTCTVTAAADAEGRLLVRRAKTKNPDSFIVVTGCLLVVGNEEKSQLLNKILRAHPDSQSLSGDHLSPVIFPLSPWIGGISRFDGHQRATIKVQDGCNFGCSFCLILRLSKKGSDWPITA
jgi:threonylcarbamoyladenosine tRNA methylthiotransferase MtaB